MKLLLDQNLSYRLVPALESLYPGSVHIRDVGLAMAEDETVWNYAMQHGLIIVLKDTDFYHRSILFGHPPRVVWVRLGNCATAHIETLLRTRQADLLAFDQDAHASFLALYSH
jgi:predicted nuclease of predicted toxin-antitoxin system